MKSRGRYNLLIVIVSPRALHKAAPDRLKQEVTYTPYKKISRDMSVCEIVDCVSYYVKVCMYDLPGMTPRDISGCPNLALSAAIIRSQVMANSQPPPRA